MCVARHSRVRQTERADNSLLLLLLLLLLPTGLAIVRLHIWEEKPIFWHDYPDSKAALRLRRTTADLRVHPDPSIGRERCSPRVPAPSALSLIKKSAET